MLVVAALMEFRPVLDDFGLGRPRSGSFADDYYWEVLSSDGGTIPGMKSFLSPLRLVPVL